METAIKIELHVNDQQKAALMELLPKWQSYRSEKDGSLPFADKTLEDFFQIIMEIGCRRTIWKHIKEEQFRQGLITGAELIDDRYMTVMERRKV